VTSTPAAASPPTTVADLLAACLRATGATLAFGLPLPIPGGTPGLRQVLVEDEALAVLLADAAGRVGPGAAPGVAWLPDQRLHLGSQPGMDPTVVVVDDAAALPTLVAAWSLGEVHTCVELQLQLDLGAPAPADAAPLAVRPEATSAYTLDPSLADLGLVVLAGPGVVRAGHVERLRALAAHTGLGVLNTWGAKGVFAWDDPAHLGTVGLQAGDADLSGITAAQVVVATGLDPREWPVARWAGAQVLEVEPAQLDVLAARWPASDRVPERPPLYGALAAALAPLYASDAVPLSPARAVTDLALARPAGGLVAADAGPAGLWLARTFTTTEPGSVVVPALPAPGFALAAALAAVLEGRPALAVTTDPVDAATAELLALATHWQAPVVLEVWGADAALPTADDHLARLGEALAAPGPTAVPVPVDLAQTRSLVEVAGEVVAWLEPAE
jgi:hypothetical protein